MIEIINRYKSAPKDIDGLLINPIKLPQHESHGFPNILSQQIETIQNNNEDIRNSKRESGYISGPRQSHTIQVKNDEAPVLVAYNTNNAPVENMINFHELNQEMKINRGNMSFDNWSMAGSQKSNISLDVKKYFWSPMYLGGLTFDQQI